MAHQRLAIIGDRIDPGFKSTRAMIDASDIAGLQALAVRQAGAGAAALDVSIGARALEDLAFMQDVVRALQQAVDLPLAFDFPNLAAQRACLEVYDPARAAGRKPIINSIAETRWEMTEALSVAPARVIVMVSERLQDGVAARNRSATEAWELARRLVDRLVNEHGLQHDDIIIDVSIHMMATDRDGGTRMALDTIRLIGSDPELAGVHVMGGIANIGASLPPTAVDGAPLRNSVERAFITLAQPLGLDTLLATPWNNHEPLPEDSLVLARFREFLELRGLPALQAVRRLYRA